MESGMAAGSVTVRLFGGLHALRIERGLPTVLTMEVPEAGVSGRELARILDLPAESIEGIFCNHVVRPLDYVVRPGDAVAFVPQGTPGPHKYFLGLYRAGKEPETAAHDPDEEFDQRH